MSAVSGEKVIIDDIVIRGAYRKSAAVGQAAPFENATSLPVVWVVSGDLDERQGPGPASGSDHAAWLIIQKSSASHHMNAKVEPKSLDEATVMRLVRENVQGLLADGAEPSTVSYTLAFVATELGLAAAPDPVNVFPVVLCAISHATAGCGAKEDPASGVAINPQGPAAGDIVH